MRRPTRCTLYAALVLAIAAAHPARADDGIFADGFETEAKITPFAVPWSETCTSGDTGPFTQDTPLRLCYRLQNLSSTRTFAHQSVADDVLGTVYDHDLALAPGATTTVESSLGALTLGDAESHFVQWTASDGVPVARADAVEFLRYDPYIELHALIVATPGDCVQGVVDGSGGAAAFLSGLTAVTVAPGTSLTGCYRAQNAGDTQLNTHRLVDGALGTLLDVSATPLAQGSVYSVPRTLATGASATFGGTWHAGFNADDTARSSAQASVTVVADPACNGIATSSTIDYALDPSMAGSATPTPAGLRIDYTISATPLHAGSAATFGVNARVAAIPGVLGSLLDLSEDMLVKLAVPAGIDMTQAFGVVAHMNGSTVLTPVIDAAARTIVLHLGRAGLPKTIDLTITARPDGSASTIALDAPSLEIDLVDAGTTYPFASVPDPDAPAILSAPLCTH
jgi:hypothetical protein